MIIKQSYASAISCVAQIIKYNTKLTNIIIIIQFLELNFYKED